MPQGNEGAMLPLPLEEEESPGGQEALKPSTAFCLHWSEILPRAPPPG